MIDDVMQRSQRAILSAFSANASENAQVRVKDLSDEVKSQIKGLNIFMTYTAASLCVCLVKAMIRLYCR